MWQWLVAVCLLPFSPSAGEVLTPPYFNIAENKFVLASATCGENVEEPELYCKLTGTNQDSIHPENLIIHGQVCDWCNQSNPAQIHPAKYAVDGSENFWMSPPLSRGIGYNEVNFTISLGQEFHVSYVLIKMGNSPRPGVWVLERSADNGETYKPWQYFADNKLTCEHYFGRESLQPINADDSVTCETAYSKIVPLQGGEIVVSLIKNRPSANDFFNSTVLQEFTRATNVRLRLMRPRTLLGHLMSIAREDPSVTRRYFYSIKDISIGGRCRCNGHADVCDETHPTNPYKLLCRCKHNTTGDNCERCQENMVQKAWRQSKMNKLFVCEGCNCFGHSSRCVYNETVDRLRLSMDIHGKYDGGGVCRDCQHFTEGINCEKCISGYYRPSYKMQNETDACQRCPCNDIYYNGKCAEGTGKCECDEKFAPPDCDRCAYGYFGFPDCKQCICYRNGTDGEHCEPEQGLCPCKYNFAGFDCSQCRPGYFSFPQCKGCECDRRGSMSDECDKETGKCECNSAYGGDKCDECADGYYGFPSCVYCSCESRGTTEEICDKEKGRCFCKQGYGGSRCDQCLPGYYGFPDCKPCNCSEVGSSSRACDLSGKCPCLLNYAGLRCDRCVPGYFNYPQCNPCNCHPQGSEGVSCDDSGACTCQPLFTGLKCEKCEEGRFNFPICEECSCHPAGIIENFSGCGNLSTIGQLCQCKPRVQGRTCNQCKPLYWNLAMTNMHACQECECYEPGVLGGTNECDVNSGQCICKPFTTSRRCDTCIDGMYHLQNSNLFGCSQCGCDLGGSENQACDKETGQCRCRARVTGRTCSEPRKAHYFPTLYQFQYEAENGSTPDKKSVRFGSRQEIFPNFSWKGYVVFSKIQDELVHEVEVARQTLYHMVLRYINPTEQNMKLDVTVVPQEGVDGEKQLFQVILKPSPHRTPLFITLPAKAASIPAPIFMDTGVWNIHFHNSGPLFLDYFVLMPAAYYEGNILIDRVVSPCRVGDDSMCRQFVYPTVERHTQAVGPLAYKYSGGNKVGLNDPVVGPSQQIYFDIKLPEAGSYVLVLVYSTDGLEPVPLEVEVTGDEEPVQGTANMPACPFTWSCRQVVLDSQGKVGQFDFQSPSITVMLQGGDGATAKIESVVAIPVDKWSMDYIMPQPVCVKKDGECLETKYFTPLDFKKIEFETGSDIGGSSEMPDGMFEQGVGLVHLDENNPEVNMKGKVLTPGEYILLIHYYQPRYPMYRMEAIVEDGQQSSKASVVIAHCPSNAGCRTTLDNTDGHPLNLLSFHFNDNFNLKLKLPNDSEVWLDYVLVVPEMKYNSKLITDEPIDNTGHFIKECGKNFFYMDENTSDFCRKAVFSVTTAYNEGALPCKCSPEGSLDLECEQFGGQCPCKPNVIGRRCEECRPGHFRYPRCLKCDCPALCDEYTGECVCPPRVVGPACDQCANYTFGYHSIVGCEPCDCHPHGVKNYNLQCNLFEGFCSCKDNVEGRQCDKCTAGYFAFPDCQQCDCDFRGTTDEICQQNTAECICKENVDGQACDVCKEGTFNLQSKNPLGCTKCFCFGKTSRCSSSRLYRSLITGMDLWRIVAINVTKTVNVEHFDDEVIDRLMEKFEDRWETIGVEMTGAELEDKLIYLAAPQVYLGNQLTAYGGYLRYSLFCTTGPFGPHVEGPDVILEGGGVSVVHYSVEQPAMAEYYNATIEISENNFIFPSGLPVTREKLMQILHKLSAIYIKALYWKEAVTTRLTGVSLDSASERPSGLASGAMSVEQCECPPHYVGLSCEECAPGFFRAPIPGPYGGFCIPCQCNGHATDCDKLTGVCFDCEHNTVGDHCERCALGYHGDATGGYPYDCLICACPLPTPSNNFADVCEMTDNDLISCECRPGYTGYRCQSCANGFYGNPEVVGDTCKPCNCSGNIDPSEEESCDSVTGECKACLNNAFGPACELCRPWFYGDAISLKNCQGCDCDKCGSSGCNHMTGGCDCRENVLGEKCDRCAVNHYAFNTCQGCLACNCKVASMSEQCDAESGQCKCQPGVSGRTCDRCAPGHWNYTPQGCTKCKCKEAYSENVDCDPVSGQCKCLPGVLGATCDHCPELTVLDPVLGCLPCDTCVHSLVATTQELALTLTPYMEEFNSVNSTFYLNQRLNYMDKEVNNLSMNVSQLEDMKLDMEPLSKLVDNLRGNATSLERTAQYELEKAEKAIDDGFVKLVKDLESTVAKEVDNARHSVAAVVDIAENFQSGKGKFGIMKSEADEALATAKGILEKLASRKPEYVTEEVRENQFSRMEQCLQKVKTVKMESDKTSLAVNYLKSNISDLDARIDDLKNLTDEIRVTTGNIITLNTKNRNAKLGEKFKELKDKEQSAQTTLKQAEDYSFNATKLLSQTTQLEEELKDLRENVNKLRETLNTRMNKYEEIDMIQGLVDQAKEHVDKMAQDVSADQLEAGLTDINALSAYTIIIDNVRDALIAANDASLSANNALTLTEGMNGRAAELVNKSNAQYNEGRMLVVAQESLDKELTKQIEQTENITKVNKNISDTILDIKNGLARMDEQVSVPDESLAVAANAQGQQIIESIKYIVEELPKRLNASIQLEKDIKDSKDYSEMALKQLDQTNSVTTSHDTDDLKQMLQNSLTQINETSDDVKNDISKTRKLVDRTLELISSIKVGIQFSRNSILELRKPESLSQDEINNYISLYFQTTEPNGLLFFLGNEKGASERSKRALSNEEYIVLEVENGLPKLTIDLGSGPTNVVNSRYVSDGKWYRAVIDRTGKLVNLTISWEEKEVNKDRRLKEVFSAKTLFGNTTVLNLDKWKSRLYVGGSPSSFPSPDGVTYNSFDGKIQDLIIGDTYVGLWNFINNTDAKTASQARDTLLNVTTTTGCRFNGEGYTVISKKSYRMKERTSISLRFKSFAEEGLLFLGMEDNNFISIEIRKGQVLFQFDLGDGRVVLVKFADDGRGYNDGKWHHVEAARDGRSGSLKVDGKSVADKQLKGPGSLSVSKHLYIGGYPNGHSIPDVTVRGFDGCIDQVQIGGTSVDLNENVKASGITPGCPDKVAKLIWFDKGTRGYAGLPASLDDSKLELILRFKTDMSDGMLVFLTDGSVTWSLRLLGGQLVLDGGGATVTSQAPNGYADSSWHVVVATHTPHALHLFVDDHYSFTSEKKPNPIRLLNGQLYLGGVPSSVDAKESLSPHFAGCLGQATLNGQLLNMANLTDVSGHPDIGKCMSGLTHSIPLPPLLDLPSGITTPPPPVFGSTEVPSTTTTTTQAPVLDYDDPRCILPLHPKSPGDPRTDGYRFGTKNGSRLEYNKAFKNSYHLSVNVNTEEKDGLIFYASDTKFEDYIGLYLKERTLFLKLRCGGSEVELKSAEGIIEDNKWYTVEMVKKRSGGVKQEISLLVDQSEVDRAELSCNPDLVKPFYLGGINPNIREKVQLTSLQDVQTHFVGCLSNFLSDKATDARPSSKHAVIPCSPNTEPGIFFYPEGGYLKHFDKFYVGQRMTIDLEVKPRSLDGLLVSIIHPKKDYLILELVNGSVRLAIDNGVGEISTTFEPTQPSFLCDGNWHKIKAIKLKNLVALGVDNKQGEQKVGPKTQLNVDTRKTPLFVGGRPTHHMRGVKSTRQYVGCIKSLTINGEPQKIDMTSAEGSVAVGVCPTT